MFKLPLFSLEEEIAGIANDRTIPYQTNYCSSKKLFSSKEADRLLPIYIIGKTRTGKISLIETVLRQEVEYDRGFCFLEPYGDTVSNSSFATEDLIS